MWSELEQRGRSMFLHCVNEMPYAGMGKIDYNKLTADNKSFENVCFAV